MSTIRQKKLAQVIVANIMREKPQNKQELLVSSGYDLTTAEKNAKPTISAKGVQKELKELGFTTDNAKRIIGSILNSPIIYEMVTPSDQIRAAQEVFKTTGEYAPEKHEGVIGVIPLLGGDSNK